MGEMTTWGCNPENTDCEKLYKSITLVYQQINCKRKKEGEKDRNKEQGQQIESSNDCVRYYPVIPIITLNVSDLNG